MLQRPKASRSSEEIRQIHGGWCHRHLLNTGSEATSSLENPSVSEGKCRAMCALLFMCFLRHPLLATFRKQILGLLPSMVSLMSPVSVQQYGHTAHLLVYKQPDKKGAVSIPWAEWRLGSNLGQSCLKQHLGGLQCPLSKPSKAAEELVLNTFLCFISLLRAGGVCVGGGIAKHRWTEENPTKLPIQTSTVFSLMLLITVSPIQTRSLIYRPLCACRR